MDAGTGNPNVPAAFSLDATRDLLAIVLRSAQRLSRTVHEAGSEGVDGTLTAAEARR
jgi:hypothetical protein